MHWNTGQIFQYVRQNNSYVELNGRVIMKLVISNLICDLHEKHPIMDHIVFSKRLDQVMQTSGWIFEKAC